MMPPFASAQRWQIAGLVLVALLQTSSTIAVAHGVHGVIDGSRPTWPTLPLVLGLAILSYGMEVVQRRICDGIGLSQAAMVRRSLVEHLLAVKPDIVRRRRQGAMLQSFVGDLTSLRQWVSEGIMRAVVAIITLAGLVGWTALGSNILAAAFGLTALCAAGAGLMLLGPLDRCVRGVRRERGRVSALAAELLSVTPTIIAFGRRSRETARMEQRVTRLNAASFRRAWLTGALRGLPHLAASILLVATVAIGPALSPGAMTAQVMLIGFLGMALRDLARAGELWIPGRIAWQRIESLLALPTVQQAAVAKRRKDERDELVVDGLVLGEQLPPMSAKANRGDVILIDSPPELRRNFIWALSGLQRPHGGMIRWDGVELPGRPGARRRRRLGLCGTDFPLLRGSVAMNLRYRMPEASAQVLSAEAQAWGLDLHAAHAEGAAVALARSMIGTPPVLLLELSDSELDDRAIMRLRQVVPDYPGVILLVTARPELRMLCTKRWEFGPDGLKQTTGSEAPTVVPLVPRSLPGTGVA